MPFGYLGNTFQTLSPGENDVSSADELQPHCRKFQHVRETVGNIADVGLSVNLGWNNDVLEDNNWDLGRE